MGKEEGWGEREEGGVGGGVREGWLGGRERREGGRVGCG